MTEVWLRAKTEGVQDPVVTTALNTLLTALYVKIDDELGGSRCIGFGGVFEPQGSEPDGVDEKSGGGQQEVLSA
ncbi:hypothetical protein OG568_51150 (plasmid) [Streptomyces sp. NBC_01450]|uniref:hypothetical protein n=1 Tax=Streptomyces sp. NBC_01450 TaxID=2903871 RepID=UPI002E37DB98|nr:hypothetical protein [Streptomyces sp. NBC_01450]